MAVPLTREAATELSLAPSLGPSALFVTPTLATADGIERRACSRALEWWRELAAPRLFPSFARVTPESASFLWDSLFMIEIADEPSHYKFVHAGPILRAALGADPTGRKVADALPRAICDRQLYFQKAAVDLRNPVDEAGRWTRTDGDEVLYRSVFLPLSDDQRRINYLLGAFSFRMVNLH